MNVEKWKETRLKGKAHFVWVRGFLIWGVTTALLWSIIMHVFRPQEPIWFRPLIALIIFPIGGILGGSRVWSSCERKYNSVEQ